MILDVPESLVFPQNISPQKRDFLENNLPAYSNILYLRKNLLYSNKIDIVLSFIESNSYSFTTISFENGEFFKEELIRFYWASLNAVNRVQLNPGKKGLISPYPELFPGDKENWENILVYFLNPKKTEDPSFVSVGDIKKMFKY